MLCPWHFVFKSHGAKSRNPKEKDVNNNVEKNKKIHG